MSDTEILVRELRERHRDREWVSLDGGMYSSPDGFIQRQIDAGQRFLWLEDMWVTQYLHGDPWAPIEPRPEYGPYMEALHYRITRGDT